MAIGAIGAVAYANQAMPAQTKMQSNFQNRLDMQNSVATAIQDADKQEIIEVRPAEETHKIDPDNEHEKEKNKEEQSEKMVTTRFYLTRSKKKFIPMRKTCKKATPAARNNHGPPQSARAGKDQ